MLHVRLQWPRRVSQLTSACSFARWCKADFQSWWRSFHRRRALLKGQTSVCEVILQVAIAICIFNHFSPLSPVHRPVCVMASFCFFACSLYHCKYLLWFFFRFFFFHNMWCEAVKGLEHVELQQCWMHLLCLLPLGTSCRPKPALWTWPFQWLCSWQRGNVIILMKHMQD